MSILIVGGYGSLAGLCARELLATTRETLRLGGRSAQRAERAALGLGGRASGLYLDASDPRTLSQAFDAAQVVLCCAAGSPHAVLERALETKTPVVCATPVHLAPGTRATLAERAWEQGVPLVLHAGAVPGLACVAAEQLVREFASLDELRIASTGPWQSSPGARADLAALHSTWKPPLTRPRRRLSRYPFPAPVGRRLVRPVASLDLEDFGSRHLVSQLTYLEPDHRALRRGVDRLLRQVQPPPFALVAEAFASSADPLPQTSISLQADTAASAAAAALGTLARALLAGRVPGGLLTPNEAINPALFLQALARRGVTVKRSS